MYLRCSQLHEMVHRDPIGIPWEPRASFDQGCQQSLDEFLVRLWCGGEAQLFEARQASGKVIFRWSHMIASGHTVGWMW